MFLVCVNANCVFQDLRNAVCFVVSLFDDREFRVLIDGEKSGVAVLAHLVLSGVVFLILLKICYADAALVT